MFLAGGVARLTIATASEGGVTARTIPLLLMFLYLWRYRDRRRSVIATPPAGIRLPDRARSAAGAHADLTMKGIP